MHVFFNQCVCLFVCFIHVFTHLILIVHLCICNLFLYVFVDFDLLNPFVRIFVNIYLYSSLCLFFPGPYFHIHGIFFRTRHCGSATATSSQNSHLWRMP